MNKLKKWWLDLIKEEFIVTIWYDSDPKARTEYRLKKIMKITNKKLEAVTTDGAKIILSVEVPYNFEIVKIH